MLYIANAGGTFMIGYIILIVVLMYFMVVRPQRKRQKEQEEMYNSLQVGSRVITIGGLHGVVHSIDEEAKTVELDCEGIILVFERQAIGRVLPNTDVTVEVTDSVTDTIVESDQEVETETFESTYDEERKD